MQNLHARQHNSWRTCVLRKGPRGRSWCVYTGCEFRTLSGRKKVPMEAVETKRLNEGWWKEQRVRASGKQKGQLFAVYSHVSGACYYSRTKAEKAGCVDTEPDKRTLRHQQKQKKSKTPKAKAKRKPKAKAKAALDPPSIGSDEDPMHHDD